VVKNSTNVVEVSRTLLNAWGGEYLFNDAERYETDATVMSQNYPVVFEFHPPFTSKQDEYYQVTQ